MKLLRRYQLDCIFLFISLILLGVISLMLLKKMGVDPHDYEWIVIGPLIAVYTTFLLDMRHKISLHDRRNINNKSITYWTIFGLILIAFYQNPISVKAFWSINLFFIIFTIFLADSYWDFKKISFKSLYFNKKNIENI